MFFSDGATVVKIILRLLCSHKISLRFHSLKLKVYLDTYVHVTAYIVLILHEYNPM